MFRWMDGTFGDLSAEVIESELDEAHKEIYKSQKIFNTRYKKALAEREDKIRNAKQRRTSRRKSTGQVCHITSVLL